MRIVFFFVVSTITLSEDGFCMHNVARRLMNFTFLFFFVFHSRNDARPLNYGRQREGDTIVMHGMVQNFCLIIDYYQ